MAITASDLATAPDSVAAEIKSVQKQINRGNTLILKRVARRRELVATLHKTHGFNASQIAEATGIGLIAVYQILRKIRQDDEKAKRKEEANG